MQKYKLFEGEYSNEDAGTYVSYGVATEKGDIVVSDISPNKGDMENFVDKLNIHDLSVEHIHDAVQDFLGIEYGL